MTDVTTAPEKAPESTDRFVGLTSGSAVRRISLLDATTSVRGLMSAADKTKLDGIVATAWTTAALTSPWVAYTTGGRSAPRHMISKGGQVALSGEASGGAATNEVLVLPVGRRPTAKMFFSTYSSFGACAVEIGTDGSVKATVVSDDAGTKHISLDGITFEVA